MYNLQEIIDYCNRKKREKRIGKTLTLLAVYGVKYNCDECIHKKTGSCEDYEILPNGCEYWSDGINEGVGYSRQGKLFSGIKS